MTYQQKFEDLRNEFSQKSDAYLRVDKEISEVNGFGDISLLDRFSKAKSDFEIAGNNYHAFISFAKKNNINPEDEF